MSSSGWLMESAQRNKMSRNNVTNVNGVHYVDRHLNCGCEKNVQLQNRMILFQAEVNNFYRFRIESFYW